MYLIFISPALVLAFWAQMRVKSSYAQASCASEKLEAHQERARWQRLFWAFTLIILPLSLIYIGGLDSLKLAVLVSALPLTIVYVFMGISLTILLKKHRGNNDISE